jgi:hypothetical protein
MVLNRKIDFLNSIAESNNVFLSIAAQCIGYGCAQFESSKTLNPVLGQFSYGEVKFILGGNLILGMVKFVAYTLETAKSTVIFLSINRMYLVII